MSVQAYDSVLTAIYAVCRSNNEGTFLSAECGDYVVEDYPDHTYLSSYKFIPQQDDELERKIMENHKKHL